MKKLFLMLLLGICWTTQHVQAQNDAITRFFEKYMDDERFTVVYVAPKLFDMIGKIETDDPDWETYREVVGDLTGLRVLTADSITDGIALYKEAVSKVPANEYSELLTVHDGQENVRIWIKDSGNIVHELLLLVGSPDEFVLLSLTGKIDLDKISTLSKAIDVQGIDQLEKVKSKN